MKTVYTASLCKEGVLGGGVYLDAEKLTYRTGKLTVSPELRDLGIGYADIAELKCGRSPFVFTVKLGLRNGGEWKFILFARKKTFLTALNELGVKLEII